MAERFGIKEAKELTGIEKFFAGPEGIIKRQGDERRRRQEQKVEFEKASRIADVLKDTGIDESLIEGLKDGSLKLNEVFQINSVLTSQLEKESKAPTAEEAARGRGGLPAATADPVSSVSSLGGADVNAERSKIQQAQPIQQAQTKLKSRTERSPSGLTTESFEPIVTPEDKAKAIQDVIKEKQALDKQEDLVAAQKTAKNTFRFLQQFERSFDELKKFDPEIGKTGFSGFITRKKASIAEKVDELPETTALKVRIQPLANGMAREIEGGRVTDQDRKIYADSFADAIRDPSVTNTRLASESLIAIIDKGGNVVPILKQFAESEADIMRNIVNQVIEQFPDLIPEVFGNEFEVVE